jgi:hypothetical protein
MVEHSVAGLSNTSTKFPTKEGQRGLPLCLSPEGFPRSCGSWRIGSHRSVFARSALRALGIDVWPRMLSIGSCPAMDGMAYQEM